LQFERDEFLGWFLVTGGVEIRVVFIFASSIDAAVVKIFLKSFDGVFNDSAVGVTWSWNEFQTKPK